MQSIRQSIKDFQEPTCCEVHKSSCNQGRDCPVRAGTHKPAEAVLQIQEPEADIWPCVNIDVDERGNVTNAKLYSPGLPAGNHDVYPASVPYIDEHSEAWLACAAELEKASPGFMTLGNMNGIECAVAAIRDLAARAASAPAAQAITLLAGDHSGMKVDYRGLFKQVQRAIKRSDPGYAEMLRQLEDHLQELGQRWYAGDTNVVDEILQLYCIERDARKTVGAAATAAPQAQDVGRGEVLVTVSGFTGSGKSAIAGEIEILCRALGLQVDWPDGDSEKHMTHADWIAALEQYKPRVRIVECNVPHSVVKGQDK